MVAKNRGAVDARMLDPTVMTARVDRRIALSILII
jgi:hypothetical protein